LQHPHQQQQQSAQFHFDQIVVVSARPSRGINKALLLDRTQRPAAVAPV